MGIVPYSGGSYITCHSAGTALSATAAVYCRVASASHSTGGCYMLSTQYHNLKRATSTVTLVPLVPRFSSPEQQNRPIRKLIARIYWSTPYIFRHKIKPFVGSQTAQVPSERNRILNLFFFAWYTLLCYRYTHCTWYRVYSSMKTDFISYHTITTHRE